MKFVAPRVGIDTNILVYALKDMPTKDQSIGKLVVRSKNLVRHLIDDQKASVCISIITLGEYLVGVPPESHASMTGALESWLTVAPFNIRAAQIAAQLMPLGKQENKGSNKTTRRVLSADVKIIASLLAIGCKPIYSHDTRFRNVTNRMGTAADLPERINLFDDQD